VLAVADARRRYCDEARRDGRENVAGGNCGPAHSILAKVGVEGSNPFGRAIQQNQWVTADSSGISGSY
jgi:hypothetical protein